MLKSIKYVLYPVLNVSGPVMMCFSFVMIIPLLVGLAHNDGTEKGFIFGFLFTFFTGLLCYLPTKKYQRELLPRDGFLLTTMIWALFPLFATIPLWFEMPDISFGKMYFEMMSGITTTGATVLTGLDNLPLSINGWRSLLSWMGGMGLIVLSVAILPLLGVGGAQIFKVEISGPMKENRLTPRIADTAKALYLIYLSISICCAVAYHLAGMTWADAIMHMMTTVSLSGFSAHDASYAYFNNPAIDVVAVVFMLICGFNFQLHFSAWHRRKFFLYFIDKEALSWILIIFSLTLITTIILVFKDIYPDVLTALRFASFNVISVASTTGYATTDYSIWPFGLPIVMVLSSGFATCAGSTGGGMKLIRLLIIFKQASRELKQLLLPKAVIPLKINGSVVENKIVFSVMAYFILWLSSVICASILLMATGMAPLEGISSAIACLTNLGPGLGGVGPYGNYSWLTETQLWICSFCMLLGRLEIMTVLVLFTRSFWRA